MFTQRPSVSGPVFHHLTLSFWRMIMNERFDDFSRLMATYASRRGTFKFTLRTLAGAGLLLLGAKRAKAAFDCQQSAVPAGTPANRICGNRKWCAQAGTFCC